MPVNQSGISRPRRTSGTIEQDDGEIVCFSPSAMDASVSL
jgi:hypothetical protein